MKLKNSLNKLIIIITSSCVLCSSNLNADVVDTLIGIPETIVSGVIFTVGIFVILMPLYVFSAVYDGDTIVTKDEQYACLVSKTYVLKENMLYRQCYCHDSHWDPKRIGSLDKDYKYVEDDKPNKIKAGTKITVCEIIRHRGTGLISGDYHKVIVVIEEGPFIGYKADISYSLLNNYGTNLPQIDDTKLELAEKVIAS